MSEQRASYDVAIAGGGLAGLTLAIQAARAGYQTLLLEKENYPFHKVCGEYISLESVGFLQRLGIDAGSLELPIIRQLELSDVKGNQYEFILPLGGFGISRYTLDNTLYRLALHHGVHVQTNTKVQDIRYNYDRFTIQTDTAIFTAKVAAGAFGKRSNLDIKWKRKFAVAKPDALNNWIGVKYHIRYPWKFDRIALHNFNHGYCGISAIEDNKCCLCYLTTADNLRNAGNAIPAMEKKVLYRNPHLQHIFSTAKFLYDHPLAISQVSFQQKQQVEQHVLMVGDAAGLITPLCGNGMSMAMHASKLAFEQINAFLKGQITREAMEQHYTRTWRREFSRRLFTGRTVQRLFGNDATTSFFLSAMHKLPWLADRLIRSTHGKPF